MTNATRTDVHRPSVVVTEDYNYLAAVDFGDAGGSWDNRDANLRLSQLEDEGWTYGGVRGYDSCQCDHCGAHLRYAAILRHEPTRTWIIVGEQCLDNRFSRATPEFHALRKQAELQRAQRRIVGLRKAWLADPRHAEVAALIDSACVANQSESSVRRFDGFADSLQRQLSTKGELSERQVDAYFAAAKRNAEWLAERQEKAAAEAALPKAPVVEGRGEISGEVLSVKWQDSVYGGAFKMLVRDDRGFKLWGTVPASLPDTLKGCRVKFNATVEKSHDDESFGFFKRPTKAEVTEEATA